MTQNASIESLALLLAAVVPFCNLLQLGMQAAGVGKW